MEVCLVQQIVFLRLYFTISKSLPKYAYELLHAYSNPVPDHSIALQSCKGQQPQVRSAVDVHVPALLLQIFKNRKTIRNARDLEKNKW